MTGLRKQTASRFWDKIGRWDEGMLHWQGLLVYHYLSEMDQFTLFSLEPDFSSNWPKYPALIWNDISLSFGFGKSSFVYYSCFYYMFVEFSKVKICRCNFCNIHWSNLVIIVLSKWRNILIGKFAKQSLVFIFFLACSDDLARIDERITLFVTYNPTVLGEAFIRNGLMIYDMPVSLSTNRLLWSKHKRYWTLTLLMQNTIIGTNGTNRLS